MGTLTSFDCHAGSNIHRHGARGSVKAPEYRARVAHIHTWVEIKQNYSRCTIQPGRGIACPFRRIPLLFRWQLACPVRFSCLIGGVNTLKRSGRRRTSYIPPDTRGAASAAWERRVCVPANVRPNAWYMYTTRPGVVTYLIYS